MAVRNGNRGSNFLFGTFGSDEINGRAGNDWMFGFRGNDVMRGGNGNDLMFGGSGNDRVSGGNGNDVGFGGSGNDRMIGGRGSDLMFGGSGNDTFVYRAERNVGDTDFYAGGSGTDRLVIRLNADEAADQSIQTDIAEFEAFVASGGLGNFTFESLGLTVNSIERLRVIAPEPEENENNAPVVSGPADLGAVLEDESIVVSELALLDRASDVDGDGLSILNGEVTVTSGNATITPQEGGGYVISPAANDDTMIGLSYTISDGEGGSVEQTAVLDITAVDDAPNAGAPVDLGDVDELNLLTVSIEDLLANATDIDSETLTASNFAVTSGSVIENEDGTLNIFATDVDTGGAVRTLDYTISDGTTEVAAQATYTVNDVQQLPPVVTGQVDLGSVNEDESFVFSAGLLTATANDPNGDAISAINLIDRSGGGMFEFSGTDIIYTPGENFNGLVTIDYDVSDGFLSTQATATLDVTAVNDAPEAVEDDYRIIDLGADRPLSIVIGPEGEAFDVLTNDFDVDGDTINIIDVEQIFGAETRIVTNDDGVDGIFIRSLSVPDGELGDPPGTVRDVSIDYTITDGEFEATATAQFQVLIDDGFNVG